MQESEYRSIGRLAGEEILAAFMRRPAGFEKAVEMVLGALAVLGPKDFRLTVPKLLSVDHVKRFMEREQVKEATLKSAVTEAKKRWDEAVELEKLKLPSRRAKKSSAAGSSRGRMKSGVGGDEPQTARPTTQSAGRFVEADETVENFVLDVPRELL